MYEADLLAKMHPIASTMLDFHKASAPPERARFPKTCVVVLVN